MLSTELRTVLRSSVAGLVLAAGGLLATPATTHAQNRIECIADFDGSGSLDIFDFLGFQNAFAAGDRRADCDRDGRLTIFDFLCFQNAYQAGESAADCDGDGEVTAADFTCFQTAFAAGCS